MNQVHQTTRVSVRLSQKEFAAVKLRVAPGQKPAAWLRALALVTSADQALMGKTATAPQPKLGTKSTPVSIRFSTEEHRQISMALEKCDKQFGEWLRAAIALSDPIREAPLRETPRRPQQSVAPEDRWRFDRGYALMLFRGILEELRYAPKSETTVEDVYRVMCEILARFTTHTILPQLPSHETPAQDGHVSPPPPTQP